MLPGIHIHTHTHISILETQPCSIKTNATRTKLYRSSRLEAACAETSDIGLPGRNLIPEYDSQVSYVILLSAAVAGENNTATNEHTANTLENIRWRFPRMLHPLYATTNKSPVVR